LQSGLELRILEVLDFKIGRIRQYSYAYEKWLIGLAPRAPTSPYLRNPTGDACPEGARGQYDHT